MKKNGRFTCKLGVAAVSFVLLFIMLCIGEGEVVKAEEEVFAVDSYTISAGDVIYMPYFLKPGANADQYVRGSSYPDSDILGSRFLDHSRTIDSGVVLAKKKGKGFVEAFIGDFEYLDVMRLNVLGRRKLTSPGTMSVEFQPGEIGKSYTFLPIDSNMYHFSVSGTTYSEIWIYSSSYNDVIAYALGNGKSTSLDVYLESGKGYYVDFITYNTRQAAVPPKKAETLSVSITEDTKASSIDLAVNAYAFMNENDVYYMLEGDSVDVNVIQGGVPNFYRVNYEIGSTNWGVASVHSISPDVYKIRCDKPGIASISVTTTNMLTDSFTVVVLGKNQIVPGDVDFDGTVTRADIVNIYLVTIGQNEKTRIYYHADMNGDGILNGDDIKILWGIVGGLPFVDVSDADWFYDAVKYNYEELIMTGMNSIQFGPYESLSRAQFALILYRLQGTPEIAVENPFKDIVGEEWYADAVLWAYDNGIVTGFGDNTFRPADLITREQMVTMMYRYSAYVGEDTSVKKDYKDFVDSEQVSSYADEAVQWAVGNGILTGKISEEGTMVAPWGATARAEAAAIIERYLKK